MALGSAAIAAFPAVLKVVVLAAHATTRESLPVVQVSFVPVRLPETGAQAVHVPAAFAYIPSAHLAVQVAGLDATTGLAVASPAGKVVK